MQFQLSLNWLYRKATSEWAALGLERRGLPFNDDEGRRGATEAEDAPVDEALALQGPGSCWPEVALLALKSVGRQAGERFLLSVVSALLVQIVRCK